MFKKTICAIPALFALLILSLAGCSGNSGKDYTVTDDGGYFEYDDITLGIDKSFTRGDFSMTLSAFTPEKSSTPLGLENSSAHEFIFEDLDEIKEGLRIFMPKTGEAETPLGFLGVYEGDGFVYYPMIGEVGEDEFFVFDVPAQAIKRSVKPVKTAQSVFVGNAYAADSFEGYILRWLMPSGISATSTDNFRIFYPAGIHKKAVDYAADELESKFRLYVTMGYDLHAQKSMEKINVYVAESWDESLDGELVGKKIGDYELYKFVFIDGTKDEKRIRDTAAHELFHVAQLPYKLPLWLEEATAVYMEKYSSAYTDYPVVSKQYYDLLFYQGFNKTSAPNIKEGDFGYGLSTYIKYIIDRTKPENDGVLLRKTFERAVGRDVKTVIFDELYGPKNEWITDYYIRFIREEIYPYGGAAEILNNFKKPEMDYSLNPESLIGRTLSFSSLEPYKPAMIQLNFTDTDTVRPEKVGFFVKDFNKDNSVDLIMAVTEFDTKAKTQKVVYVRQVEMVKKAFLSKKYLTDPHFKVYLIAVNKTGSLRKSFRFSLRNTLLSSSMFEDIDYMDVTVSYSVTAVERAKKAFLASNAEGDLTAEQRRARWDAVVTFSDIVDALKFNGQSFQGTCRVGYDKKRSLVKFYFSRGPRLKPGEKDYTNGYLTNHGSSIFASVYKDQLVVQDYKGGEIKTYGKGSVSQSEDGSLAVTLNITREIFGRRDHDKHGSIVMDIRLSSR